MGLKKENKASEPKKFLAILREEAKAVQARRNRFRQDFAKRMHETAAKLDLYRTIRRGQIRTAFR